MPIELNKFKINGRHLIKDNDLFLFNGGSGFAFKIDGKGFLIAFEANPVNGYFYVIVDRDYQNKIKVYSEKPFSYSFVKEGTHYVDIVKANEAIDNTFKLKDFAVNGQLLKYDFNYLKKVKVYGDSTIAGYGILTTDKDPSVHVSDSVKDFCYQALYELNYESEIFSASGWGLVFSAYTSPKNIGVIDFIDKVAANNNESWKDDNKYDLLIISLGTNDWSYIVENQAQKELLTNQFIDNYRLLIEHEIKLNKDIKILMIYGTLKEESVYSLVEQTYQSLHYLYPNLFLHCFANGDNSAISNHAYVSYHSLLSAELKDVILNLLK